MKPRSGAQRWAFLPAHPGGPRPGSHRGQAWSELCHHTFGGEKKAWPSRTPEGKGKCRLGFCPAAYLATSAHLTHTGCSQRTPLACRVLPVRDTAMDVPDCARCMHTTRVCVYMCMLQECA